MRNFEHLGRPLSKAEQAKLIGGFDPEPPPMCKATTTNCVYLTVDGTVYSGKCAVKEASGMQLAQCGCKYDGVTQPANECKQTVEV